MHGRRPWNEKLCDMTMCDGFSMRKTMKFFLQLGLGLGLLLVPAATALPSSQCQRQCGNVEIPYPFGIVDTNCSFTPDLDITCQVQGGISTPYMGDFEVLSISLADSTVRVLNYIGSYCYNASTGDMDVGGFGAVSLSNTTYLISDVRNRFTVIGCNALVYITNDDTGYQSGCVSTCRSLSDLVDGSCSGMGCCQTTIPKGMYGNGLVFSTAAPVFNDTSSIWKLSRCVYALMLESATFSFSTTYINSTKFNDTNGGGRAPMVIDWAIRDYKSCQLARRNDTGTYACLSSNSVCVDSANGPGYVCACSQGYQGNPYLLGGCQDIDECNSSNPCPSGGVCHNTVGGYRCSCRAGRKFSKESNACNPHVGLIIGVTTGFLGLFIIAFCGHLIIQKRKLKKHKQEYFRQHGGLILFERMKMEKGLSLTVFTESQLIHATNNFEEGRILGKGGHGTVYKGMVDKDNMAVAIKKCALVDERQKKEFGQEMLILSQINHKNVVKLVGCCLEVDVPILVYEFIPNGTLFQLIHGKNQALQISLSTLLRIAHEAAEGLSFLHSYASPPIIHGDVKTANILLDDSYTAKVSDFGASVLAPSDKEQFVTMVQGTCGYLDPEYMQTCQLTDKSDVYSFGVILAEILTGQLPLKLHGPENQRCLASVFLSAMKENNLDAVLLVKGQESNEVLRAVAELAKQCLDMCGSNRPSMKEIADELNRLRRKQYSLHPWVRLGVEVKTPEAAADTESLLRGPSSSTGGSEIEIISAYSAEDANNQPRNPTSSYYAR